MEVVSRKEDQSPNGLLTLARQPDGDIVIIVTEDPEIGTGFSTSVEFRTGEFGGGGGSPYTFKALQKLFEAMEKDNIENRNSRAV